MTAEGDLCGQNFCESPAGQENKCSSWEVPTDLTDRRCDVSHLKGFSWKDQASTQEIQKDNYMKKNKSSSTGSERVFHWI